MILHNIYVSCCFSGLFVKLLLVMFKDRTIFGFDDCSFVGMYAPSIMLFMLASNKNQWKDHVFLLWVGQRRMCYGTYLQPTLASIRYFAKESADSAFGSIVDYAFVDNYFIGIKCYSLQALELDTAII